jgi:hypothetical protein
MSEPNRFFINLTSLMLNQDNYVIDNVFNALFDNLLENERFQEAVSNSINTYNDEIFNKTDEYMMQDLPILNYKEEKCLICLDEINKNELIYKLKCKHIFHKDCLNESIQHQHYDCPLCKTKLDLKKKINWQDEYENEGHKIKIVSKID